MNRISYLAAFTVALLALASPPGGAQPKKGTDPAVALAKKVTITFERGNGGEFLAEASKACGATFVIDRTAFDRAGVKGFDDVPVGKVQVKDVTLAKVLADTLKAGGSTYAVEKDYILVLPLKK